MTDINSLIAELRAEADAASRSGQTETLHRLAARIEREVAEVRREAAEKAWDEGYKAGWRDSAEDEQRFQMRDWWSDPLTTPNPYRKETNDDR